MIKYLLLASGIIKVSNFEHVEGKKPILTLCWNCFFDLHFVDFVITIMQNGLPQRILPLLLTVKLRAFVQNPVHLRMVGREKLTHPLPEVCHSRRCLQDEWPFSFASSPPLISNL